MSKMDKVNPEQTQDANLMSIDIYNDKDPLVD